MDINDLIVIIQTSVAPCVLISGVGLLLLSMTNRIGRPIDRIRLLIGELKTLPEEERGAIKAQIEILYKRAVWLQWAISFAILSIFFTSMVILILFLSAVYIQVVDLTFFIEVAFALALMSLVASLVLFLMDIREYLRSIRIEIDRWIM